MLKFETQRRLYILSVVKIVENNIILYGFHMALIENKKKKQFWNLN